MNDDPFDWRRAFSRLRFARPEPALREIAAHLHHVARKEDGRVSPDVLTLLAEMIDPDNAKPVAGVNLELRRLERKAPPAQPNYELRQFLEQRIDVDGEPVESVVADAVAKFKTSRSQCFRDLAVMRKWRKDLEDWNRFLAKLGPADGQSQ
jgi:hypothetical protein